jgi:hypothetical protein
MHASLDDGKQLAGRRGTTELRPVVVSVASQLPAHRALHRRARLRLGGGIWRAVIERHRDIGAQCQLRIHGVFGREAHRAAVDGRTEHHAFFGDLAQRLEAEHLEAAGIREDGTLPMHEAMQSAVRAQDLVARPQHQVKRVAEHDLRAQALELLGRHGLHGSICSHRHERGRLDHAVRQREPAAAREARGLQQLEFGGHRAPGAGVTYMASP